MKSNLFAELKRRHVYRVAVAYAVVGWLLIQFATQVFPVFALPDWTSKLVVLLVAIGFPIAVVLAWAFELTPEGIRRTEPADSPEARAEVDTHRVGKLVNRVSVVVMALAIVLLLVDRLALHRQPGGESGAAPEKSIAVLPLTNDSGDKDQQYFSDGLSENLIVALSQFKGLTVIGRNSAFQFRESKDDSRTIGTKLGVAHLLEGSVQRAGDVVRISAELINAANGHTLWSERYDRPYKDLFQLQDEITRAVAGALQARLLADDSVQVTTDHPPSGNLDAYNAYLQGKFYEARATEADFRTAIEQYTRATQLDPRYALAWSQLSRDLTGLAAQHLEGEPAQQAYARSRVAVDTALKLDPDLAASHWVHGYLLTVADFDWSGAQAEYRRALELAPNDATTKFELSKLQATLGQVEQAALLAREALASDPLNARWYNWLAAYYSALDRLDEAETAIRKGIDLQPAAVVLHWQLAVIKIQRGDAPAALAAAEQEPAGPWREYALSLARQIGRDRSAADAALQNVIDNYAALGPFQTAEVYALRNDADKTFEWLDRAWTARDPGIQGLLFDPLILRFRDDPRFAAYCKKVGLPTTTTAKALREPLKT
jgi:serine/threonine-protein kinase